MRLTILLTALVALLLSGCRTTQTVDPERSSLPRTVQAGDRVEVTMRDGRVESFVVSEVTPDALVGTDIRIPREDIRELKVHAVHKGRTLGAALDAAGIVVLVAPGTAIASLLGGGG